MGLYIRFNLPLSPKHMVLKLKTGTLKPERPSCRCSMRVSPRMTSLDSTDGGFG